MTSLRVHRSAPRATVFLTALAIAAMMSPAPVSMKNCMPIALPLSGARLIAAADVTPGMTWMRSQLVVQQSQPAVPHQRRADQQHQSQTNLHGDERAAEPLGAAGTHAIGARIP